MSNTTNISNTIKIKLNGKIVETEISGHWRLLDMIRDKFTLTGTKEGCAVGECGACTVIMNGEAVCSCLVLAAQCDNADIETIESMSGDKIGRAIQEAFVENGGTQCGFCTPGLLMSTKALLDKNPSPSDDEIKTALEGNICRCTGYQPIMQSIHSVIANQ